MQVKKELIEFEWDRWNIDKSYLKHGVEPKEAEEIFVDSDSIILPDFKHSQVENRFIIVGRTLSKAYLFIIFTYRSKKVRVISARRMHKKEVEKYEQIKKGTKV